MIDYTEATKAYLAKEGEMRRSLRTWQGAALGLLAINATLCIAWVNKDATTKIVPWIVQVDSIGKAVASGPADSVSLENEKVVRAFLFRFIEQAKSVITDASAMEGNLRAVYRMAVPSVSQNFLNPYYKKNDPFQLAAQTSRTIRPLSLLKQSENTYLIEWEEENRDMNKRVTSTARWKAYVTISMEPKTSEADMKADPFNPFGIYITDLNWSQDF